MFSFQYVLWFLLVMQALRVFCAFENIKSAENVRRCVRGRKMIMDNLRRYHNNLEPIKLSPAREYQPPQLPNALLAFLDRDFLSAKDSSNLFSTCRYINQERSQMINTRLSEFNKYYVSEEQWLNNLMYSIIKANFPENFTLNSEGIHDHLELMTLKYITKFYTGINETIPRHFYYAILTFIHETVYGPGEIVPSSQDSWQQYMCYKIKGFRYPLTVAHFSSYFGQSEYKIFFEFLLEPRTKTEREQKASTIYNFTYLKDNFINFEWNYDGYLPESEALTLLKNLGYARIYSEHILKRIWLTERIETHLLEKANNPAPYLYIKHTYLRFIRFLYQKQGLKFVEPIYNCATYIKTRDLYNPFDALVLKSFADFEQWNVLRLIARSDLCPIIQMDMLSKFARSGFAPLHLIEPDTGFKPILQFLADDHHPFFELVLIEYPRLVNLENLCTPFSQHLGLPRRHLIAETLLSSSKNNPLAMVKYIGFDLFLSVFPHIEDKINLNVAYDFDCVDDFFSENWTGRIMTFREILWEIDNSTINRKFGLIMPQDFEESEQEKASYPVISFHAFLEDPNSVI